MRESAKGWGDQYRYMYGGKRETVYAPTFNELRQKEKEIQEPLKDRLNYAAGTINTIDIENELQWCMKKYQKRNPNKKLPTITPHVLRHTFCTNMARSGMAVKNLQYLMGHSDVGTTLNIYTHSRYEDAAKEMLNISVVDTNTEQKKRKIG